MTFGELEAKLNCLLSDNIGKPEKERKAITSWTWGMLANEAAGFQFLTTERSKLKYGNVFVFSVKSKKLKCAYRQFSTTSYAKEQLCAVSVLLLDESLRDRDIKLWTEEQHQADNEKRRAEQEQAKEAVNIFVADIKNTCSLERFTALCKAYNALDYRQKEYFEKIKDKEVQD